MIARLRHGQAASRGRILCYHSVGQPNLGVNDVSPQRFRRQLEFALGRGHRFVPADVIARGQGQPQDLAITFDDGCATVATNARPVLQELGIPATVFVVSEWANGNYPEPAGVLDWRGLGRLLEQGVEIGSHSRTHPDFARLQPSQIADELGASRTTIERELGIRVTSFAIPYGQSMNWNSAASAAARDAGYEYLYAQAVNTRPAGTIARNFVTRFDDDVVFGALLDGAFDSWEEWVWH